MAAVPVASARRTLERRDIRPVYYLTGPEDILKNELVDDVVDATVEPPNRAFNVDVRSAGDLNAEQVHALVETPPLLADRRVAVIRHLELWRKNAKVWQVLYSYLDRPSPSTVLVLVHGADAIPDRRIADSALHVDAASPNPGELVDWIQARALRSDVRFESDAIEHLVRAVGVNLSEIATEIEKLAVSVPTNTVTVADVENMVGIRHGETLDDWVFAAILRDTVRAVQLLDIVIAQSGVTAVKMVMTLGTAVVGVRLTRALLDSGKTTKQVEHEVMAHLRRTRPYGLGRYSEEIARWLRAAKQWTASELDGALRRLYEADQQLKSTTISDPRATICTTLLHMAATRVQ